MLLWVLMWASYYLGFWWLTLLLAVPAAGFLVRLFMIQHDCGHGAFFRHRLANDWIGRALGVLTLTPYDFWRRTHAIHHATSGNLERRGIGDIDTLTVREYLRAVALAPPEVPALSPSGGDVRHRPGLSVHPAAPAAGRLDARRLAAVDQHAWPPMLAIAIIAGALIWLIGLGPFLLVHVPIMLLAAAMGVWLFYVQHQFEHTLWADNESLGPA